MKKRLITGAIMLAILLPLVIIDNEICEILFCVLALFMTFVGGYEYTSKAILKHPGLKKLKFVIPTFASIVCFLALNGTYQASSGNYMYHFYALLGYLLLVGIILGAMIFTSGTSGDDVACAIFGLTYCGLVFGYALSIRYFKPLNINKSIISVDGIKSFLFVYTIVIMTDSFAYLVGRKYGKKKLCPQISPNKTVEGAIAGGIGGALFGVIGLYVYQIIDTSTNIFLVILIGYIASLFISCFVQVGDLIESKLKRTFDVKDFGYILPGHGGILDRFDSFIYSGFMYFIIMMITEIILIG